jgi:peroxiredoxin Q/BCP
MLLGAGVAAVTLAAALPGSARAQQPTPPASPPLEIGAVAPDFALPGGTRFGVLTQPVRLSDFKGEVVVLAFFFRARTRG